MFDFNSPIATLEWETLQEKIDYENPDFLQDSTLRGVMFSEDHELFSKEIKYIEQNFPAFLEKIINPTKVGNPPLTPHKGEDYNSNDVHHLYHLCRYLKSRGEIPNKIKVLEWGGGYGNFCKIIHLIFPSLVSSYTIIDLPNLKNLTQSYLQQVIPDANFRTVNVLSFKMENLEDHDMFISTWALSESPSHLTDYLDSKNFFNCSRMLIALHQCGTHIPFMKESSHLKEILERRSVKEEDVEVVNGTNSYFLK